MIAMPTANSTSAARMMEHAIVKLVSMELPAIRLVIILATVLLLPAKSLREIVAEIALMVGMVVNVIYVAQISAKTKHAIVKMLCVALAAHLVIMEIYVHRNAPLVVMIALLMPLVCLVNQIVTEANVLCSAVIHASCQLMEQEYAIHQLESVFLVVWMDTMVTIVIGSALPIVIILLARETLGGALEYVKRAFMALFAMNRAVVAKL